MLALTFFYTTTPMLIAKKHTISNTYRNCHVVLKVNNIVNLVKLEMPFYFRSHSEDTITRFIRHIPPLAYGIAGGLESLRGHDR